MEWIRFDIRKSFTLFCAVCCALIALGLRGVAAEASGLSVGGQHALAILPDGTLWGWGYNLQGQLGIGGEPTSTSVALQVGTNKDWKAISAGGAGQSVALKKDGSIYSWGFNSHAQSGNGISGRSYFPVRIGEENDWKFISAGGAVGSAIKNDGSLYCWGNNPHGMVGDGTTTRRWNPVRIGNDNDWVFVSNGDSHSGALKADGSLYMWGANYSGGVGDGTTTPRLSPFMVGPAGGWKAVSAGARHTLAIKKDGSLYSWGMNDSGQLGDGTIVDRLLPVQVGGEKDWVAVQAGARMSLALKADGRMFTWGLGTYGRLGGGSSQQQLVPVQIGINKKWELISVYHATPMAVDSDGNLYSWGYNQDGLVGDGTRSHRSLPVPVVDGHGEALNFGSMSSSSFDISPILSLLLFEPSSTYNWQTAINNNDTYNVATNAYHHGFAGFLARLLHRANHPLLDSAENEAAIRSLVPNGSFYSFSAELTRRALFTDIFPDIVNVQYHIATQYDPSSNRDVIIILFQGSKEVSDWIHDATFPSTEFLSTETNCHYGIYGIFDFFISNPYTDTSLLFKTSKSSGLVTLQEYFNQVTQGEDNPMIVLAGHSLGGALASMFGAYLLEQGISAESLNVYTFGAPPIGRESFALRYRTLNQFDIKNTRDIVPYSTTFCGDYVTMGQSYEFTGSTGVNLFSNLPEGYFDCAGFVGANIWDMVFDVFGAGTIDFKSHNLWCSYIKDYYPSLYSQGWCDD